MTGDGVNDVLSLKQADLGIAMQSGSRGLGILGTLGLEATPAGAFLGD